MKTLFCLLLTLPLILFSQEENTKGVIKIRKTLKDSCYASVLGYIGTNFITKRELFKAEIIELNAGCNCELLFYTICYGTGKNHLNEAYSNKFFNGARFKKATEKIEHVEFENILVKNKNTGEEINLPSIRFNITD